MKRFITLDVNYETIEFSIPQEKRVTVAKKLGWRGLQAEGLNSLYHKPAAWTTSFPQEIKAVRRLPKFGTHVVFLWVWEGTCCSLVVQPVQQLSLQPLPSQKIRGRCVLSDELSTEGMLGGLVST